MPDSKFDNATYDRRDAVNQGCCVYLIINMNRKFVKIGVSADPFERLAQLKAEFEGQSLHLYGFCNLPSKASAHKLETAMHRCFIRQKVAAEWFEISVVELSKKILEMNGGFNDEAWCNYVLEHPEQYSILEDRLAI